MFRSVYEVVVMVKVEEEWEALRFKCLPWSRSKSHISLCISMRSLNIDRQQLT